MTPTLYKYASRTGLDILINSRLKVTPPSEFNDVFEFQPIFEGSVPRQPIRSKLRSKEFMRSAYEDLTKQEKMARSFRQFKIEYKMRMPRVIRNSCEDATRLIKAGSKTMVESLSTRLGIVCFSQVPDSLLMWAHYAESHHGILIEFDTSHHDFSYLNDLSAVTYSSSRPRIRIADCDGNSSGNGAHLALYTKSVEWEYEKEWRATFDLNRTRDELRAGQRWYFAHFSPQAVRRVIFGKKCPPEFRSEVFMLRKTNEYDHLEFAEVDLDDTEYRLVIKSVKQGGEVTPFRGSPHC